MGQKRIKLQLEGKRFGKLLVIKDVGVNNRGTYMWLCKCDCGKEKVVKGATLVEGTTKSCGCLLGKKTKHGLANAPEYNVWIGMKERCYNPLSTGYYKYGGRGITVCERWKNSFERFYEDMGIRPSDLHSIDRYPNNDGNYEPLNCRWATDKEQLRNTRRNVWVEYRGERFVLTDLAKKLNIHYITLRYHLRSKGVEDAILAVKNNAITTSKFRGVCYEKLFRLWVAYITVKGKRIKIGRTKNEYKAALMYNEAAIKYLGDKAKINHLTNEEIIKSEFKYGRGQYSS